ncbi:MAG TPA: FAD-binding domain [Candidatus Acidoferrales bacterium]|nr:FAD-binding domain [Candidatus Acidoferrales bacterium]
MSVLISGMGIAGPTLAYWLSVYGIESTLIERAPHWRAGGYVIDFWGSGYDVAERMGLVADLERDGYRIMELRLVNRAGRRVGGFNADVFQTATRGRYVSIPRSDLARNICRKIEGRCETIFGDSIREVRQGTGGVEVEFGHARPRRFDAVVGADGLHSIVRQLTFGKEECFEKYLGLRVAAFEATGYRPRDEDIYFSYGVPGKQVGRLSLRDDRTLFLFIFTDQGGETVDPFDTRAHKRLLRAQFENAGWECPWILEAMEACDDIYFDRVSQIQMGSWSKGRVGLIGDAAFCPSFLAGQGSALAMVSAYVLAGELSQSADAPEEALQRYESLLHSYMSGKQRAAAKLAASFVPRTRWGIFLRNQTTRAFALPFVAKWAMGSMLLDRFALPDY